MARSIETATFQPEEFERFTQRLREQASVLRTLCERPQFGEGPVTLGAELELCLIGADALPRPVNLDLLAACGDPQMTPEIDRFNIEYNLRPFSASGTPFTHLTRDLTGMLERVNRTAAVLQARACPIGILPTLRAEDLHADALTDLPRYHALNSELHRLRHAPFEIRIDGEDPLTLETNDIALEGANTSFQLHLRVPPAHFAATYNAAQIATAIALAVSANSPIFLGHQLWDETRVALFKQSLDYRDLEHTRWRGPARVGFGHGWVRQGPVELFDESIALFSPLLPICTTEDADAVVARGEIPQLRELRLHQGTVWRWNRAIYDPDAGGHFRIEMRALPAGPTPRDMASNAALLLGLTVGLRDRLHELLPGLPFSYAEWNFYRAAQHGLDAKLLWPSLRAPSPREHSVGALYAQLRDVAHAGLASLGVDEREITEHLGVIDQRVHSGQTGARWLRARLDRERVRMPINEALSVVVEEYFARVSDGAPVGEWAP